ncbi:hypothetical protein CANCADRAFT_86889 [Tortispora caseinolytica NRRL Y-17796]|uniref:ERAD-associated E3 ubiquitin-protein ligase component HRD3 n=1 Tax=Tortispora caseinolytica NRRL Y-17796 TaxID=767744 RepID=A0A1E4TL36_9ASCO|nr:hypothetical protein CANCADRAFT_86889 [Tortispora caseinolytica NRRL Y-17796]
MLLLHILVLLCVGALSNDPVDEARQLLAKSDSPGQDSWSDVVKRFLRSPQSILTSSLSPSDSASLHSDHLSQVLTLLNSPDSDPIQSGLLRAELALYGHPSYPRNYTEALLRYKYIADTYADPTAQSMTGFLYGIAPFNYFPRDLARSNLYHTLAAAQGNLASTKVLGYRYLHGLSVPKDCSKAVQYYQAAAEYAMDIRKSMPPFGPPIPDYQWYLPDFEGGLFGAGASASNSRAIFAKINSDEIYYFQYMAATNEFLYMARLGYIYLEGTRYVPQDLSKSYHYFHMMASQFFEPEFPYSFRPGMSDLKSSGLALVAAAYVGYFNMMGFGVPQNFSAAYQWFYAGGDSNTELSKYSLGYLYEHGLGVDKNLDAAAFYYKSAAAAGSHHAMAQIAKMSLLSGDIGDAINTLERSASANTDSAYYIANIYQFGVGRPTNCDRAAHNYKSIAERITINETTWRSAFAYYDSGNHESALIDFLILAEQGYDFGQVNAAYLLDRKLSVVDFSSYFTKFQDWIGEEVYSISSVYKYVLNKLYALTSTAINLFVPSGIVKSISRQVANDRLGRRSFWHDEEALINWMRASEQANFDAMVKVGDYYYKGIGINQSYERAVSCYEEAAEMGQNSLAYWNWGYMYENGLGLPKDFHLAKRYYDRSLAVNPSASLPVTLSLFKLRLASYWNSITGGQAKPIDYIPEDELESSETKERRSHWRLRELWSRFLANEERSQSQEYFRRQQEGWNDLDDELLEDYESMAEPYDGLEELEWDAADFSILAVFLIATVIGYAIISRWIQAHRGVGNRNGGRNNNREGNQRQNENQNGDGRVRDADVQADVVLREQWMAPLL